MNSYFIETQLQENWAVPHTNLYRCQKWLNEVLTKSLLRLNLQIIAVMAVAIW
jgi:hypothetical protein